MSQTKILKAKNSGKTHPVVESISQELATLDALKYVKIYKDRIKASNELSKNGKLEPITKENAENIVGVELLIDITTKTIQFFTITSSIKGNGEKMVSAVVNSTPEDWNLVVFMDWSGGFWNVMTQRYPRLIVV